MKDNKYSFKNIFKRETKLATYIIAVTTILVIGLSYALFFQVNSNSGNQVVKSGDLAFTYSKDGTVLPDNDTTLAITDERCFYPMNETDANSLSSTCSYQFSIQNTGTLDAAYTVYLKATENNTANPAHLKVILRQSDGTTFNQLTSYPKTINSLTNEVLLTGDLGKNDPILVYSIQIYLDEALADDADYQSKVISYKLEGKSVVHEDQGINTATPNGAEAILTLVGDADPASTDVIDRGDVVNENEEVLCTNTLAYDEFGNLRYVGANPCNYVAFNDERTATKYGTSYYGNDWSNVYDSIEQCQASDEFKYGATCHEFTTGGWRIVGVFDGNIKIIRFEDISNGVYTDIEKLLNPGYETNLAKDSSGNTIADTYVNNSLYWNRTSGNCYTSDDPLSYGACDYSNKGIKANYRNMIDNHTWNIGTFNDALNAGVVVADNQKTSDMYNYESYATNVAYIATVSVSDYGYAVGDGNNNTRANCLNTQLYDYVSNRCFESDWLDIANAFLGNPINMGTAVGEGYYPALYLKNDVKIVSGTGTQFDPYILSFS